MQLEAIRSRPESSGVIWSHFVIFSENYKKKYIKMTPKLHKNRNLSRAYDPCKIYSGSSPSGESQIIVIPL